MTIEYRTKPKYSPSMFSTELLQAINDWQRGGPRNLRLRRGATLRDLSRGLPHHFRTTSDRCYRRLALNYCHLFDLGERLHLAENVSAWTLDESVAAHFKGGVPPPGWQGVIFSCVPKDTEVVINLDALYRDEVFREACDSAKHRIRSYNAGMGRYSGSQCEVVLDVPKITTTDIFAIGGYSSDLATIARMVFGSVPTSAQITSLEGDLREWRVELGARWLHDAPKDRIVEILIKEAARLGPRRAQERASGRLRRCE